MLQRSPRCRVMEDVRHAFAFGLIFLATLAVADDAAWIHVGGAGDFGKNKHIRMVREHVWIAISNKSMRVHALFEFKNEGPAETVTMAFPDGLHGVENLNRSKSAIKWFKSQVDGKLVKVVRQQYNSVGVLEYDERTYVWLKKVAFRWGQVRLVSVDYEARHGDIGDYIQNFYVLQTGASWKGPIGRIVVDVDWSALHGQMEPRITKQGSTWRQLPVVNSKLIGPKTMRLTFNNVEPDFDIGMAWAPTFWNFYIDGKRVGGHPFCGGRQTFIDGLGSDPVVLLDHVEFLLGGQPADPKEEREAKLEFKFASKSIKVVRGKLMVNGKPMRLKRQTGLDDGELWVKVRDVVRALGGTYRYDAKLDRAYMRF